MAKPEKAFANMLRVAINEAVAEGGTRLRIVADALVTKAMAGDVAAIKELADRIDGKVPQGVIGGDDGDPPISVALAISLSATGTLIAAIAGSGSAPALEKPGED